MNEDNERDEVDGSPEGTDAAMQYLATLFPAECFHHGTDLRMHIIGGRITTPADLDSRDTGGGVLDVLICNLVDSGGFVNMLRMAEAVMQYAAMADRLTYMTKTPRGLGVWVTREYANNTVSSRCHEIIVSPATVEQVLVAVERVIAESLIEETKTETRAGE